jgi:hypothetical protein
MSYLGNPDSAAICTRQGTLDYEENCRVAAGSWRSMVNENMTLFCIRKFACKPPLNAIEMREELAAYFLNGRRADGQNDCA